MMWRLYTDTTDTVTDTGFLKCSDTDTELSHNVRTRTLRHSMGFGYGYLGIGLCPLTDTATDIFYQLCPWTDTATDMLCPWTDTATDILHRPVFVTEHGHGHGHLYETRISNYPTKHKKKIYF
jgi:hypothetical protein